MKTLIGRRGLRAAAVLTLCAVAAACSAGLPDTSRSDTSAPASASEPPTPTPVPSGTETLAPVATGSATPTPLANIAQTEVTYSPPPPPTPWPSVEPGLWRWQGVVVDEKGQPVDGVCIAVGPHGCQPSSPRTDARGAWYIDFPQAPVNFDLHFTKDGFTTFDVRVTPTSDWTLNVTLKNS